MKLIFLLSLVLVAFGIESCRKSTAGLQKAVIRNVEEETIQRADSFLKEKPQTVTAFVCVRSAGGIHDFYSEGDYWWPDPENPGGPYIRRDGESNPGNFTAHRMVMSRFSDQVATLTSAWLLTRKKKYADKALEHLKVWFVDTATCMNPNMLYAQAVWGRYSGRGIGLIDAYHLVEVAQSVKVLIEKKGIGQNDGDRLKIWFREFLRWMTIQPYGIEEMNAKNNHGTCWAVTASMFASLTGNQDQLEANRVRFKKILLPEQMAADGSFPLELERTKPYGYSLFNLDAMVNLAQILSTSEDNLFNFSTPDGRSLQKGMDFMFPYIQNKNSWPFRHDVFIWDEWPARQSSLLFAGLAYSNKAYIEEYLKLPSNPQHPEVIRNLPVRHPVIWLAN